MWLAVFFGLYVLLVHTAAGRSLDEQVFAAVPRNHSMWFRLSGALLGSEALWAAGGLAATVTIGLRSRRRRHLVVGLATVVVSTVAGEVLKHVLLSRPSAGAAGAVSNSFPSGHTVVAAAVVVAIWFVSDDRWRPMVAVAGSLVCAVVGMVTIVQQWHRPSDVLSAYALVAACACAGGAFLTGREGGSPDVR